jgi:hypothetical protein
VQATESFNGAQAIAFGDSTRFSQYSVGIVVSHCRKEVIGEAQTPPDLIQRGKPGVSSKHTRAMVREPKQCSAVRAVLEQKSRLT